MTLLEPTSVDVRDDQFTPHWQRATPSQSRYDRAALALIVIGFLIALRFALAHQLGTLGQETEFYGGNGIEYHARRLLDGQPFTYRFNPPGYQFLVAGTSRLTGGDFFLAGKLLSVFATGVFVGFAYLLARTLIDARVALATALLSLIAVIPFSFLVSIDLVSAASMLAALWLIVRPSRRWWAAAAAAGVVAGIAYLIRWHAIALLIGAPLCLLFLEGGRPARRRHGAAIAAFIASWLLITSPWLIWNWRAYGAPFANNSYMNMAAHFHSPEGDASGFTRNQMGERFHSMAEVLRHNPIHVAKQYARETMLTNPMGLMQNLVRYPGYLFFGAGLLLLLLRPTRRLVAFALLCALGYAVIGLVGFYARFYLFLVPALVLPTAFLLFHPILTDLASRLRLPATSFGWGLCFAIAALSAYQSLEAADQEIAAEPHYLARAADWLRQHSRSGDTIAITKPHIARWSGLGEFYSYAPTLDGLIAEARRDGVRYFLFSPAEQRFTAFSPLADTTRVHPDLTLVYRDSSPLTLIYELRTGR